MQSTKLDSSVETVEERLAIVNKILEENPNPNEYYLEALANYLVVPIDREEKKAQKRKIISHGRRETMKKHEISYEGLAATLESGEDGIYNLMGDTRRNTKLNAKRPISQKDLDEIPELIPIREAIDFWIKQGNDAVGRRAYKISQFIKDYRQYQYIIRDAIKPPIAFANSTPTRHICKIYDKFEIDKNGNLIIEGASYCDPNVCSAILCNYSRLKQEGLDDLEGDLYFFMLGFDKYCGQALKGEPILEQIVIDKIDGYQNSDIQKHIMEKFGVIYKIEQISSLYRNRIPRLIAYAAQDDYIDQWYLNNEKGEYKKCSRCGKIKLAHKKYFTKNPCSNDSFYSICKDCRRLVGKID